MTDVAHAVVAFYEGARNHGIGALLTNNATIRASLLQIRAALAVIDRDSAIGRDILIPFLDHADPMVRCEAAQALHATRRDLAVPVLQDISLSCVTEACLTAGIFLVIAGEPNKSSTLFGDTYPAKYDDKLYREALERFDRGAA